MKRWLEVAVVVPEAAADAIVHRLIDSGAPGVIEEAEGSMVRLRAHFAAGRDVEALRRELASSLRAVDAHFPGCASALVEISEVADEDWADGWKRGFPPLDLGRRLRVRTPWSPSANDRLEIEILPAMAFGTGHHASTLGCLLALEDLATEGRDLSSVLDVGTGSGILAIAAARLGARRVLAIDNDEVAAHAAEENVGRNGVGDVLEVRRATVEAIDGAFTLLLANLTSDVLRALFPRLAALAAPGARLVASGLLDEDRAAASAAAAAAGWREAAVRSIDGWTTLVLAKAARSD